MPKKDIKDFTLEDLKKVFTDMQESPYRVKQVYSWLYKKSINNFYQINNIPKRLKEKLRRHFYISTVELSEHLKSKDKTEKFLFKLSDGRFIETVLISAKHRKTICLSSQVGCKFNCLFCASGRRGFARNLTPAEIINQILFIQNKLKHKITNYVFMGMGEPLDNYQNLQKAILIMNSHEGLSIGARRITISTCGLIPGINKLKDLKLQVNLSVSLHAANNKLRNELVPINRRYPLEKLIRACERYRDKTNRIITLEYVLIKNKNDLSGDTEALAAIATKLRAKVNLIAYSKISGVKFKAPTKEDAALFKQRLAKKKVAVTLRQSKGQDIQAACGQLAGRKA